MKLHRICIAQNFHRLKEKCCLVAYVPSWMRYKRAVSWPIEEGEGFVVLPYVTVTCNLSTFYTQHRCIHTSRRLDSSQMWLALVLSPVSCIQNCQSNYTFARTSSKCRLFSHITVNSSTTGRCLPLAPSVQKNSPKGKKIIEDKERKVKVSLISKWSVGECGAV